jgi:hypothetical protein
MFITKFWYALNKVSGLLASNYHRHGSEQSFIVNRADTIYSKVATLAIFFLYVRTCLAMYQIEIVNDEHTPVMMLTFAFDYGQNVVLLLVVACTFAARQNILLAALNECLDVGKVLVNRSKWRVRNYIVISLIYQAAVIIWQTLEMSVTYGGINAAVWNAIEFVRHVALTNTVCFHMVVKGFLKDSNGKLTRSVKKLPAFRNCHQHQLEFCDQIDEIRRIYGQIAETSHRIGKGFAGLLLGFLSFATAMMIFQVSYLYILLIFICFMKKPVKQIR